MIGYSVAENPPKLVEIMHSLPKTVICE